MAGAAENQIIRGEVKAVARLQPAGRVEGTTRLNTVIALPLRNQESLTNLLAGIYDPSSPNYHHYLSPEQFAESFGPTAEDYQAVVAFVQASGLTVTSTHPNRTLLNVSGTARDLETVFHVTLNWYQHPTEARMFFAPGARPSINLTVPVLAVRGLDNFKTPRSFLSAQPLPPANSSPRSGSGNGGTYLGKDFRAAYAPGVSLTGTGQTVGLVELDAYYPADVTHYERLGALTAVPIQVVAVNGFDTATPGSGNVEVAADIEMALSMAPGLTSIYVYEGSDPDTVLNRMATDNKSRQLSCSWGFDTDVIAQQIFQQFAAQGQSFFEASGDSGAFSGAVEEPSDDPYITTVGVGGTQLSTTGPGGAWSSETAWSGSSGGISTVYPIPAWQQGVPMSLNGGSTTMRNTPDVAMAAYNILVCADNGQTENGGGTSLAAPLWAAFTALVNQQAAVNGQPPIGFINPALYRIGLGSGYHTAFHDITTGNNENTNSPAKFRAVAGYDLCTGWGTPAGVALLNALLAGPPDPLVISPDLGFTASGPAAGPLNITSQNYTLTNVGTTTLNWTVANDSTWLAASPAGGSILPGGFAIVTAALAPPAANTLIGSLPANLWFTNLTTGAAQTRGFALVKGNGGFENGVLTNWTLSGNLAANYNTVVAIDDAFYNFNIVTNVDDGVFVHSGIYGLALGENGSISQLSQVLPTVAGQLYSVSFWLDNIASEGVVTPNELQIIWNGKVLFGAANMSPFGWTNMQFLVSATATRTTLEFTSRNDPGAFGLDDISVQAIPAPVFQAAIINNGLVNLSWSSVPGLGYQIQTAGSLSPPAWSTIETLTATGAITTASFATSPGGQAFYRIVLTP